MFLRTGKYNKRAEQSKQRSNKTKKTREFSCLQRHSDY